MLRGNEGVEQVRENGLGFRVWGIGSKGSEIRVQGPRGEVRTGAGGDGGAGVHGRGGGGRYRAIAGERLRDEGLGFRV
jgi:hypothetical protein